MEPSAVASPAALHELKRCATNSETALLPFDAALQPTKTFTATRTELVD
jgi:hypothetical protein